MPPLRLFPEEKEFIEHEAYIAALTVSDFARKRLLGKRIVSRLDDHIVNELRKLGGLQKHLATQMQKEPEVKAKLMETLNELLRTIKRIG